MYRRTRKGNGEGKRIASGVAFTFWERENGERKKGKIEASEIGGHEEEATKYEVAAHGGIREGNQGRVWREGGEEDLQAALVSCAVPSSERLLPSRHQTGKYYIPRKQGCGPMRLLPGYHLESLWETDFLLWDSSILRPGSAPRCALFGTWGGCVVLGGCLVLYVDRKERLQCPIRIRPAEEDQRRTKGET